jgi:hypothetical protein
MRKYNNRKGKKVKADYISMITIEMYVCPSPYAHAGWPHE